MSKIGEIISAALAALGRLVGRVVHSTIWIAGKAVRTTSVVFERVFDVAKATGKLGFETAILPVRIAGKILGGGRQPSPAPQDSAARAADAAIAQQRSADHADDSRQVLTALRRVAQARALGETPDAAHLGRLPPRLLAYVSQLPREECDALARKPTADLRILVAKGVAEAKPDTAAPVADITAARTARRESLKAATRGAMKGEKPVVSAEDILALTA